MSLSVAIQRGGSSLVVRKPLFSTDSSYLLICSGFHVKVFSVSSGECLLQLHDHTDTVTSTVTNPHNKLQVYTCSLDCTVKLWDLLDGALLKTFHLPHPVLGVKVHENFPDSIFVCLSTKAKDHDGQEAFLQPVFKFKTNKAESSATHQINEKDLKVIIDNVYGEDRNVAFGGNGSYIAGIGKMKLLVHLFNKDITVSIPLHVQPTCIACHKTSYAIAVGNELGKIQMFHNFHKKKEKLVESSEHWHAHRVEDLCYAEEGSFLFSVGHECTLVQWDFSRGFKDFLPRLGAPISHIACSSTNQLKAVSLVDNAVLILSGNKITHRLQGLSRTRYHPQEDFAPVGLQVDPRTKALVRNGRIGHLQFYHLDVDKLLYSVDITGENYVSSGDVKKALTYTEVMRAVFDLNGDWLATIEKRDDKETSLQTRLKFWKFDQHKQTFLLSTTIETPHDGPIIAMNFRPRSKGAAFQPSLVTTSEDGKFKVWMYGDNAYSYKNTKCWNCETVGFYKEHLPSDGGFSSDGSLLAVGFGQTITLWDPDVNALKKTLYHTSSTQPIRRLEFCRGQSSHLLVSTSVDRLSVWDLLRCELKWSVLLRCEILTADPSSELLAVFDFQDDVYVFHPSNPKPVFGMQKVSSSTIRAATFAPCRDVTSLTTSLPWQPHSQLYFMTQSEDLYLITSQEDAEKEIEKRKAKVNLESDLPLTPFADFLTKQRNLSDSGKKDLITKKVQQSDLLKEFISTPPHILPSVLTLCSDFSRSLLLSSKSLQRQKSRDESDSDDDKENTDDESDMEVPAPEDLTDVPQNDVGNEEMGETELQNFVVESSKKFSYLKKVFKKMDPTDR